MEVLTRLEKSELVDLEKVIRRGMSTFVEVGEALWKINEKRLYRERYANFSAYMIAEFDMSRAHGHRLINAFKVVSNLSPVGDMPTAENQVRELANLTPETQRVVWAAAQEAKKHPSHDSVADVLDKLTEEAWESLPAKDRITLAQRSKRKVQDMEEKLNRTTDYKAALFHLRQAEKKLRGTSLAKHVAKIAGAVEKRLS